MVLAFGSGYASPAGSRQVRALQHRLARAGFIPGPFDGRYGRLTRAAVMRFQAARGLVVDGIAGPITLGVLGIHGRVLYPGSGYAGNGSTRVQALQRRLRRAGFSPGPVDGRYGPLTEAAVARFQAAHGLTVSGIAGPVTLARLARHARHAGHAGHAQHPARTGHKQPSTAKPTGTAKPTVRLTRRARPSRRGHPKHTPSTQAGTHKAPASSQPSSNQTRVGEQQFIELAVYRTGPADPRARGTDRRGGIVAGPQPARPGLSRAKGPGHRHRSRRRGGRAGDHPGPRRRAGAVPTRDEEPAAMPTRDDEPATVPARDEEPVAVPARDEEPATVPSLMRSRRLCRRVTRSRRLCRPVMR